MPFTRARQRQAVAHAQVDPAVAIATCDAYDTGLGAGLHPMVHSVLHQGLEHQQRQPSLLGQLLQIPLQPQPAAQPLLLHAQVLACQLQLPAQGGAALRVAEGCTEQVCQILH